MYNYKYILDINTQVEYSDLKWSNKVVVLCVCVCVPVQSCGTPGPGAALAA